MLSGVVARARSLWRGIRRRSDVEGELREEFRVHLELRAADLVRSGLTAEEAARRARLEFGSADYYQDAAGAARGLRRVDQIKFSWLDFKLGFRMLVRYPWLTLVGGFAMAFAIWASTVTFEFVRQVVNPTLPLDEGDRIVALRNWDTASSRVDPRVVRDFITWRDELKTIDDIGAARTVKRNLIAGEGLGASVEVAEITASAFRLTRVVPLLGRALVQDDEAPGAADVLVIGYDVWRNHFASDPNVVGRTIRLDGAPHTVVGVMPDGFAFPVSHELWAPLRLNTLQYERGEGPALQVFGRLAATRDEAQAELSTIGQRATAEHPTSHEHLRPQVVPYARSVLDISTMELVAFGSIDVFVALLLMVICANVALLLFARAATRESEIVVRTALGASRSRIITQLFAEALVLGGVAATAGLTTARFGLARWLSAVEGIRGRPLAFWFSDQFAPTTLIYAGVLTLLGAVIAGVVPALRVTRGLASQLRHTSAGGGGFRFGGLWTAVIVMQVAFTVAFPAVAFFVQTDTGRIRADDAGIPAREYVVARLEMEHESSAAPNDTSDAVFSARFAATTRELERRLLSGPGVIGVTFAEHLPLMSHPWHQIEVDEGAVAPRDSALGHRVSSAAIDLDYFDVLGTPILSGRSFHAGDLASGARVAIVNASFVDEVLGGRNPIGRRVRYVASDQSSDGRPAEPEPWYEIVGVARDLGVKSGYGRAGMYLPAARGDVHPLHIAVHLRGDPRSFIAQLRQTAAATDPALQLHGVIPLNEVVNAELAFRDFWFRLTVAVSAVALLLSLTGVYAVMSFTVSRRTRREIGIRVALGADKRRIVLGIFRRPLTQVALGILVGSIFVAGFSLDVARGAFSPHGAALFVAYAVLMMGVCALACIVPTRRALRVQPTEALRSDG